MKVRNGFVSNSSSSSFIVKKCCLTNEQLWMIENHTEVIEALAKMMPIKMRDHYGYEKDGKFIPYEKWKIEVSENVVYGRTFMANFDMKSFFDMIGICNCVMWEID